MENTQVVVAKQSNPIKENARTAVTPFLKTITAGLLGALVGRGVGRSSLVVGAAVTFAGHMHGANLASQGGTKSKEYEGDSPIVAFGLGMMAGGAMKPNSDDESVSGTVGYLEGVKERLQDFKDDIYHRLYIDKIVGNKTAPPATNTTTDQSTSGVGEITFYGKDYHGEDVTLNESELDRIERQLQRDAVAYDQGKGKRTGVSGGFGEIESRLL